MLLFVIINIISPTELNVVYVDPEQLHNEGYIILNEPYPVMKRTVEKKVLCHGGNEVSISYENDWNDWNNLQSLGQVNSLKLNGEEVPKLALFLREKIGNRAVTKLEIKDCGFDKLQPLISGFVRLYEPRPSNDEQNITIYFKFTKNGIVEE